MMSRTRRVAAGIRRLALSAAILAGGGATASAITPNLPIGFRGGDSHDLYVPPVRFDNIRTFASPISFRHRLAPLHRPVRAAAEVTTGCVPPAERCSDQYCGWVEMPSVGKVADRSAKPLDAERTDALDRLKAFWQRSVETAQQIVLQQSALRTNSSNSQRIAVINVDQRIDDRMNLPTFIDATVSTNSKRVRLAESINVTPIDPLVGGSGIVATIADSYQPYDIAVADLPLWSSLADEFRPLRLQAVESKSRTRAYSITGTSPSSRDVVAQLSHCMEPPASAIHRPAGPSDGLAVRPVADPIPNGDLEFFDGGELATASTAELVDDIQFQLALVLDAASQYRAAEDRAIDRSLRFAKRMHRSLPSLQIIRTSTARTLARWFGGDRSNKGAGPHIANISEPSHH